LQRVSKYARETWEFVNLYSKTRGVKQIQSFNQGNAASFKRQEVKLRNAKIMDLSSVIEWTNKESKLGNPALEKYAAEINDSVINKTLEWSKEVNKDIAELVFDVPPFPFVKEVFDKIFPKADLMVVSQTPGEALQRMGGTQHPELCKSYCGTGIRY
jgi:hypothetical protein